MPRSSLHLVECVIDWPGTNSYSLRMPTRVICFGDSDNDLSMFEVADESYAPANTTDAIKSAATAVIGHHDDEGIARFLRERFELE
jgi:hydroxymethylpyrimidine pyrophosphatase-like HAD family hydrolase